MSSSSLRDSYEVFRSRHSFLLSEDARELAEKFKSFSRNSDNEAKIGAFVVSSLLSDLAERFDREPVVEDVALSIGLRLGPYFDRCVRAILMKDPKEEFVAALSELLAVYDGLER